MTTNTGTGTVLGRALTLELARPGRGSSWTCWDMIHNLHPADQAHSEVTDSTRTAAGFHAAGTALVRRHPDDHRRPQRWWPGSAPHGRPET